MANYYFHVISLFFIQIHSGNIIKKTRSKKYIRQPARGCHFIFQQPDIYSTYTINNETLSIVKLKAHLKTHYIPYTAM